MTLNPIQQSPDLFILLGLTPPPTVHKVLDTVQGGIVQYSTVYGHKDNEPAEIFTHIASESLSHNIIYLFIATTKD